MYNIITVTCPICKGMLEIDVVRKQVVRHFEHLAGIKKEDLFAYAVGKAKTREERSRESYEAAKEKLHSPKRDLDELMKGQ